MITFHAEQRMNQRGITLEQVDVILTYGKECSVSGGCSSYYHRVKNEKQMLSDGLKPALINKCRGIYVICQGDMVITTCHAKKRYHHG